jgi:hypothetical protein
MNPRLVDAVFRALDVYSAIPPEHRQRMLDAISRADDPQPGSMIDPSYVMAYVVLMLDEKNLVFPRRGVASEFDLELLPETIH